MTKRDKNLRILDAVYHEAGLVDADEGRMTPEMRRDADAIMSFTQARLAELRRAELQRAAARGRMGHAHIRPSVLAMTRDAMLTRLRALCTAQPGALFAHRSFEAMTDEDLRTALEDAESSAEREA